jgi:surface protein
MDFRLYINKQECDLNQNFAVQLSYAAEDTQSPSAVLTEYSKTITLPRTGNNDLIFNFIGELDRVQADEEGYFTPLERMPMTLTYRGAAVLEGYAKLESVSRDSYSVSLYSGVADFFYSLTTDTDGDTFTLDRLRFETNLDFNINKETVKAAWDRLNAADRTGTSKWDIINFAPMYNGLPDDVDASKALINISGSTVFTTSATTDGGKSYSTYQNSMLALAELSTERTEWQVGDLRSYCQRPVLNVAKFFSAIQRTAEGKGYNLILDKGFFNDLNPYFSKSWITLPMITQLETEGDTWTGNCTYTQSAYFKPETLNETGIEFKGQLNGAVITMPDVNGKSNLNIKFSLSADINYSGSELFTGFLMHNYTDDRPSENMPESATQWNNSGITVQFYLKDYSNDGIIAASPSYTLSSLIDGRLKTYPSPVGYGTTESGIVGTFKNGGGSYWQFTGAGGITEFDAVIEDIPKVRQMYLTMAVYSHSSKLWPRNEYWLNTAETGKDITNLRAATESGELEFTSFGKTGSNAHITPRMLFGNMGSAADFMISYAKMFGLRWLQEGKDIYLMTRNRYYTNTINDYSADSDRSNIKTTPLVYNKRYFDLKNETDTSYLSEKYERDWGADYGRQRVDTGYKFDSDVEEFFKDMEYKGGVYGKMKSNYYRHIKGKNWNGTTNKEWIPSPILDKITYSLVKDGNDPDDTKSIDAVMDVIKYINYNETPRYDCHDRMCFSDADNGAVEGNCVLVFFNGFGRQRDANGYDIDYMLTDDLEEMFALNGDNATWLLTNDETIGSRRIAYRYNSLPDFSRYYTNGTNSIVLSFDLGEPRELYCGLSSTPSSTIYYRFWKKYLTDQMNVDTRKINVPLLFRTGMDAQTLRDFVRIDNQIYMLNSADYTIGTTGTTEAELIKINDTRNYTQGQSLIYANSVLLIDALEQNMGYEGGTASIYVDNTNVEDMRVVSDSGWISGYVERNSLILNVSYNGGDAERQGYVWIVGKDLGGFDVVSNAVAVKQAYNQTGGGDTGNTGDRRTLRFTIVSGDTWNNPYISAYTADNRMINPTAKTPTGWTYGEDVAYLQTNGEYAYSLTSYSGFEGNVEYRNMYYFFANNPKCETIETARMDVSKCTDMESAFEICGGLASLDLSNWDTSQVVNMNKTFSMCSNLASMDVSNFNTSKVETMDALFNACSKLTSIDVSRWDTIKVKNMCSMFSGCKGLTSLDVSHFNTSQCNRMDFMFSNCTNLTSLNVSNWDVSKVIRMRHMFWKCAKLKTLDLSNWNISNVLDIDGLFEGCSSLETLDMSNWSINENAVVDVMFKGCSSLSQITMRNCDAHTIRLINFALSNAGILNQVTIITE